MRKKPPNNYREMPEVRAAYEEGGKSIGRAIMWDLSKEEYFWKLIKGIGLWPRWYLTAFKGLYKDENPKEYKRANMYRFRAGKRKKEMLANEAEIREKADRAVREDLV